jgi:hypothetical protein
MAMEASNFLLCNKVVMGLIKGILLSKLDSGQLVNDHFVDDSFLTILEEQSSWDNMMECLDTFCATLC